MVELVINGSRKGRDRTLSEAFPVDEDGGSTADTDPVGFPEVAVDERGELFAAAFFPEPVHIQFQLLCELFEQALAQFVVICKHLVVVFPELSLFAGGKGGLGRRLRQLVVPDGEVLEDHLDFLGIFLEHLLEDGDEPRAVRSLEVIEDGNGHRRVGRAFEWGSAVVEIVDHGQGKYAEFLFGWTAEDELVAGGAVLDSVVSLVHFQGLNQIACHAVYGYLTAGSQDECPASVA